MIKKIATTLSCVAVLSWAMTSVSVAEDAAKTKKVKPMCPVSGKAIDKMYTVSHNGGDVYFCCPNCPKAFEANTEKFAPKANHQLVVTKQAKQTACPFTGKKIDETKTVSVAKVDVHFCCANCLAKAESAEDDELLTMVFADKPFNKGFKVKAKKAK